MPPAGSSATITPPARPSFAARLTYFGLESAWMDALQSV
jgi:hypothetical protein